MMMETSEVVEADDASWHFDQPRSAEDIAELEADLAAPPPGRSFANDFRRRSITVTEWQALKTKRATRATVPRSRPRAARRSPVHLAAAAAGVVGGAVDTEPPPGRAHSRERPKEVTDPRLGPFVIAMANAIIKDMLREQKERGT